MSSATPARRYRAEEPPAKRTRRTPLETEPCNAFGAEATPSTPLRRHVREMSHSGANSSQSKRKRGVPTPSSCRKRRRSSHHDEQSTPFFESKKVRLFKPDVEMEDAPAPVTGTPSKRKRKKILKEVLRSEKISRSALRNLSVNNVHATHAHRQSPQKPKANPQDFVRTPHTEHTTETTRSQRRPNMRFSDESVELTGEEHLEELDASQCSEAEKKCMRESELNKQNPFLAKLMDDGRCFVRIVRADGAVDYYTLYPHDEAHRYYERTY